MFEGLKDVEKCIEFDLMFLKGYSRKGVVQFFMKEYDNVMEIYQEGFKYDFNNQEFLDGVRRYIQYMCKNLERIIYFVILVVYVMCCKLFFVDVCNRLIR